ncbi:MAG: sulfotransferase family protein [Pseudomonadota bacterium]
MALKVIGAGLGRTGTLSLKLALEHIGFGPCHHMSEVIADLKRAVPLWIAAGRGTPDWEELFAGFSSCTDYPGCMFWRQLIDVYPDAKVILTVRDADKWFESGSATVFSPGHRAMFEGEPLMAEFFAATVFDDLDERLGNRAKMVEYFNAWNDAVIAGVPAERLLVFRAGDGWEPLCRFLGVPVPPEPYPRVNSREEMTGKTGEFDRQGPPPPEVLTASIREYLADLRAKAFPQG